MSAALAIIDDWTEGPCPPRPAPSRARARPYLASRRHADGRVTTYDANGNRTQQIETNGSTAETTTYQFDTTDRLTQAAYPDKATTYTYDAAYNRLTEKTINNATAATETDKTYGYNNRNQLTGITDNLNSANNVAYTFDVNGNQTGKTKSGVPTTFAYDVKDQLLSVREGASTLGVFFYDYQGMRVVKDMGGSTVRYTYDDKSVLLQTDISGQTIAKYDYGTNRLLSLTHTTEGRQFYLFDALGSVSNLTTPAGAIQARYQYDAFGHQRAQAGSSYNRFTFTGHEQDKETNLYYFKARFYDPDTGRFLSQDSYLGDVNTPPSLHRYLYAYSNPLVYIDPDGHIAWLAELRDDLNKWADDTNERIGQTQDPSIGERIFGGLAGVGTGLGKAAAGIVGGVNYGANWTSMATGGFGNDEWGMAHAKEISATHDTAQNVWQTVSTDEGRAGISQQLRETKDAWLAGDMKAMAQITGFFGELGAGGLATKVGTAGRVGRVVDNLPGGSGTAARVTAEAVDAPSARTVAQTTQRESSQIASKAVTPAEAQAPRAVPDASTAARPSQSISRQPMAEPSNPYDVAAWQKRYEADPGSHRSVGAAAVDPYASVPAKHRAAVEKGFEGTPEAVTLDKDLVVYRHWGGKSQEIGSPYFSPKAYSRPGNARRYLALPEGNTAANVSEFIIPRGTTILQGKVASQVGSEGFGSHAIGGGTQIYVDPTKVLLRK